MKLIPRQGFSPNYSALAGCRTLLGLFEAGCEFLVDLMHD